jgi:hypothetical protein
MGWLIAAPEMREGERVLWRKFANRQQSAVRVVGGRLFLTDQRLIFQPHRLDAALGGEGWSAALKDVEVSAAARQQPFALGPGALATGAAAATLRRRLRVRQASGAVDIFILNGLSGALTRIEKAVKKAGAS